MLNMYGSIAETRTLRNQIAEIAEIAENGNARICADEHGIVRCSVGIWLGIMPFISVQRFGEVLRYVLLYRVFV